MVVHFAKIFHSFSSGPPVRLPRWSAGVLFGSAKLLYIGLSSTFSSAHVVVGCWLLIATKSKRALSKGVVLEKKHKLGSVRAFFNFEYYNKERIDFN